MTSGGFSIVNSGGTANIYGDKDGLTILRDTIDKAIERGSSVHHDHNGQARVVVIHETVWRPRV